MICLIFVQHLWCRHYLVRTAYLSLRSQNALLSSSRQAEWTFAVANKNSALQDKASIRKFLANGYFSKATLAVEITKVRFGVKSTTARLITLAILMNGQPV